MVRMNNSHDTKHMYVLWHVVFGFLSFGPHESLVPMGHLTPVPFLSAEIIISAYQRICKQEEL